ncbi:hypothetical protein [Methylacidiphilum kamchatkense]|uniref:Uncharacterized protein n=1 Tax=Methylacidiphilum kamchatkense Kam1 TaxID=1202785 RepID=A0A516TLZ2_9BACT|nr:hypothetical protein [Methylacidiphilum kamchatkense]QDQ42246.1 hypothetical protein kam1_1015 [Methylacidiphilum kamchatkense Kam1]
MCLYGSGWIALIKAIGCFAKKAEAAYKPILFRRIGLAFFNQSKLLGKSGYNP